MSPPLPPQDKESKKITSSLSRRRKESDVREEIGKLQQTETKKGRQLSSSASASSQSLSPSSSSKSQFSSQEVWKHNTKDSCWLTIHGRVYDVTLWLQSHPGGSDLLLAAAGRDATQLFEMYHPFVLSSKEGENQMKKRLESCCIGFLEDYKPHYLTDSGFYKKTSRKVWKHLKNHNIDSRGLQPFLQSLTIITFFIFSSYLFSFLHPLLSSSLSLSSSSSFFSFSFVLLLLRFLSSITFGISSGLFEAHCKHDTSHGVLIRRHPSLHNFIVFCDEFLLGGSLWAWLHQHVIGHHVFTNIAGLDPDLPMPSNSAPLPSLSSSLFEKKAVIQWKEAEIRRVSPLQPSLPRYYLQHFYVPLLYAAVALKSRLEDITWTFFKRANGPVSVAPIPIWRWEVLPYFFISEVAMGYFLALNFQVSHIAEGVEWPHPHNEEKQEWAIAQIRASQDYAHGSLLTTWFSGALNYQVTHHLFPGVSQYVYPAIAPVVLKSCKKFGIPYRVLPSFRAALGSHIGHLKSLSYHSHYHPH